MWGLYGGACARCENVRLIWGLSLDQNRRIFIITTIISYIYILLAHFLSCKYRFV
jgi:hypothetical protein